jgi:hypothetical protein
MNLAPFAIPAVKFPIKINDIRWIEPAPQIPKVTQEESRRAGMASSP